MSGRYLRSAEVSGGTSGGGRHAASFAAPETGSARQNSQRCVGTAALFACAQPGRFNRLRRCRIWAIWFLGWMESCRTVTIERCAWRVIATAPVALVLGAEGPGLRRKDQGIAVDRAGPKIRVCQGRTFGSLNVSNAAAIALYASQRTPSLRRRLSAYPTENCDLLLLWHAGYALVLDRGASAMNWPVRQLRRAIARSQDAAEKGRRTKRKRYADVPPDAVSCRRSESRRKKKKRKRSFSGKAVGRGSLMWSKISLIDPI